MDFYGDPHWRGRELTEENIEREKCSVRAIGQRSGTPRIREGTDEWVSVSALLSMLEIDGYLSREEREEVLEKYSW